MFELIGISLLIMAASLVGVLAAWGRAGAAVERNLDYLVSFSAGVFLVFLYGLAMEALEHSNSTAYGLLWILAGAVGIWILAKFLPGAHAHPHEGKHKPLDPRRLLLTDSIHNMADGIFLAASYAVSPVLALSAGISIFVHEVLQEVSEFFVLRDAGYSVKQALLVNVLVSASILIGAIGGYFLLEAFEVLEGPLLGLAAGGILVVVLHDLLPHSVREAVSPAHYAKHLLLFGLGALLMLGVSQLLPHEEPGHGHEEAGGAGAVLAL